MVLCCLFCIEPIDEASIMITRCSRRPNELKPYSMLSVACRGYGTVVRTLARIWSLWIFNFQFSQNPNNIDDLSQIFDVCVRLDCKKMKENKRKLKFLFWSLVDFHFLSFWVIVYGMAFLLIKMMSCQFLILLYKPCKF